MNPATVVVIDLGFRLEPRQTALALQERGIPFRLKTSLHLWPESLPVRLTHLLDRERRPLVEARLLRRHQPGLDRRNVRRWLFPDLLRQPLRRLGLSEVTVVCIGNVVFDWIAAATVSRGTAAVVTMQGSSLATLRRAHRRGARTVVFANSPDPLAELAIVAAEGRRLGLTPNGERLVAWLGRRIRREYAVADLVIANSEFTRRDLIAHGVPAGKVATAALGVDLERFAPTPRPGNGRVLYVGSIQPRKGVIHLATAVGELRKSGYQCELHAYGSIDPAYGRLLEPFVASGTLHLHSFVSHHLLADVYATGDIFAFPTLSDGFGAVVYEAMAAGLPVIATDRCGAPVRDGIDGLVVPHADAGALQQAIARLLDDPSLAARFAVAGLETARGSSWHHYRERVGALLAALSEPRLAADGAASAEDGR